MTVTVSATAPLEAARGSPLPTTSFEASLSNPRGAPVAPASAEMHAGSGPVPTAGADGPRIEVTGAPVHAARMVERLQRAQGALDRILALAESGRSFTPSELLALQAVSYRAGHELEVAGKLVEKATSAVKQTLQTQL